MLTALSIVGRGQLETCKKFEIVMLNLSDCIELAES